MYDIDLRMICVPAVDISALTRNIDMKHVDAMLSTTNRPLSDSAERLRQFLVTAQRPQKHEHTMLENINALSELRLSPNPSTPAEKRTPNNDGAVAAAANTVQSHPLQPNSSQNLGILAAMLQQQFSAQLQGLEERLTERIIAAEQQQEARFVEIMQVLRRQPQLEKDMLQLD